MKRINILWIPLTAALMLIGCGDKKHDTTPTGSSGTTPTTGTTDLTKFVKDRVAATDDVSEPIDVDVIEFTSTEDETAFDDLLK